MLRISLLLIRVVWRRCGSPQWTTTFSAERSFSTIGIAASRAVNNALLLTLGLRLWSRLVKQWFKVQLLCCNRVGSTVGINGFYRAKATKGSASSVFHPTIFMMGHIALTTYHNVIVFGKRCFAEWAGFADILVIHNVILCFSLSYCHFGVNVTLEAMFQVPDSTLVLPLYQPRKV